MRILFSLLLLASGAITAHAQTPAARVLGTVTAVNAGQLELSVQNDQGELFGVKLVEGAPVRKLAPGETNLSKAETIPLKDVAVGDRVLARGQAVTGQKALLASSLIVNSRTDIAKKHERDREEWLRRGVVGIVKAVDPAAKTVQLERRSFRETTQITVSLKDGVNIKRYAPDSVRFADAKTSTLAEVKPGDQLRALGDKNEDGTQVKAEEIVFGTFQTVAGTVSTVDAAAEQLTFKDAQSGKVLTVKLTKDSNLRRLPPFMAQMMAARAGGGAPEGFRRPEGGQGGPAGGGPPQGGFGGGRPGGFGGQGGPGGPGGPGRGDPSQMLERFPAVKLDELKAGDAVMVSSTVGAQADHITAITLIAGVEPLLAAPRPSGRGQSGGAGVMPTWNLDIGLPQ